MSLSPSILLRKVNASIRMSTGLYKSKLNQLAESGNSVILMYHRIVSPKHINEYVEPGMYVTPETFKMHLSILKQWFSVVSLRELTCKSLKKTTKPLCAITFDDGWLDFYTNAWPLLRECSLPATNFLPTEFIGTDKWFWTDQLADIIRNLTPSLPKQPAEHTDIVLSKIERLTGSLFSRINRAIKYLKPNSQEQIQEILEKLKYKSTIASKNRTRIFMNWEECRSLNASGLITFGSHTAHHIIMTAESEQQCNNDLKLSQQKLIEERVVESSFIPFCYPNGGNSPLIANLVEKNGYNCAVTTNWGWISETSNPYTLNRIGMHQDMTMNKGLVFGRILG